MNPEEQQEETLRKIAVDMLTRIDNGTRMTSDGIARYMMDLVANYGYRSYEEVAKRVLAIFHSNPDNFRGDTPLRYHNLSVMWREQFPESYEEHQQRLRAQREAKEKKDAEDKSVVDLLMDDLSRGFVGFEPTEGNE
jgi:hypothetical protein